jgi:hypothetical protein
VWAACHNIQIHRESRLTAEELLRAEFSLLSNPKLYKEDNPTVGRLACVEVGSNTSTMTLRVVEGDKKEVSNLRE